ncbi:hypothetical protein ZWY2020_014926 [Hordeum vulgare]|nr:hypothetical protein ZWY2020_014926 [Hordeum vulgare]
MVHQEGKHRLLDLGFHYPRRSAANLAKGVSGMAPGVVPGGSPESSSLRAILCDLQACISEPARIFHYWTRSILRGLLNPGSGKEIATETQKGGQPVNAMIKGTETGTAEKEYSGDCHHKKADNNYGDGDHGINDDSIGSSTEDDDDDGLDNGWIYRSSDDHIDRELPPPSHGIYYDGNSDNLRAAYSFSQYRVELFAVCPRFHFVGTLAVTNGHSFYWSTQKDENSQCSFKE